MNKNERWGLLGDGMREQLTCFGGELAVLRYPRDYLDSKMRHEVEKYEKHFNLRFETIDYYPGELLHWIFNAPTSLSASILSTSMIASQREVLARVGNLPLPAKEDRQEYLSALLAVYRTLERSPAQRLLDPDTLFIGVQREGRILAEGLGWLPSDHFSTPHAKRMPFADGLMIGLAEMPDQWRWSRAVIVDGAIATGATLVSIMSSLKRCTKFELFSVHATIQAGRALEQFRKPLLQLDPTASLELSVGYMTDGIDAEFYATEEHAGQTRNVIGDLGDTIADLF